MEKLKTFVVVNQFALISVLFVSVAVLAYKVFVPGKR